MSAPHVAGIAALAWESNPLLTSAQMRERLRRTSDPVLVNGASPNTTWGHGKVNALNAITETVVGISGPLRALPGENLTLRADEKSSGPYGNAVTYSWTVSGGTVTPPTGPATTFTANVAGDYTVTLTASPGSAPFNLASATIRVNTPPTASISGPTAVDNVVSVVFTGTGADADNQALSFHWILLARPADSNAVLTASNPDNVTLVPDITGTYEVGLRADDGLDNSDLVTKILTATGTAPPQTGGGGGGCSVGIGIRAEDGPSSLPGLLLLLLPLGVLSARKRGYRFLRHHRPAATKCR